MKQSHTNRNFATLFLSVVVAGIFLVGCAGQPGGEVVDKTGGSTDGGTDREIGEPGPDGPGGGNPDPLCPSNTPAAENFNLTVGASGGANVVFLIDDSTSMKDEIAGAIDELTNFLSSIGAATTQNYRVVLVYDQYADQTTEDGRNVRDQLLRLEDFYNDPAYDNKLYHFRSRTWSKWADLAFVKAFAPIPFMNRMPNPIPPNKPLSAYTPDPNFDTYAECQAATGTAKYFRPVYDTYGRSGANTGRTPLCSTSGFSGINLKDHLFADVPTNVIALSDDDIDTYPSTAQLAIHDVIQTLKTNTSSVAWKYHSIVALPHSSASCNFDAAQTQVLAANNLVDRVGCAHMGISDLTGGTKHEVSDTDNYNSVFSQIAQEVIFSEQGANLACAPGSTGLGVFIKRASEPDSAFRPLDASTYTFVSAQKRVQLKPAAFAGFASGDSVVVRVAYNNL